MSSFAQNLRGVLERSFVGLPFLLFTWSLFVGSTTGNIGLIVLTLGQATVVPLLTWFSNWVLATAFEDESWKPVFTLPKSATCNLLPTGFTNTNEREYVVPSYWLAQIIFFFSFLISNAASVLNIEPSPSAPPEKVERRKSQAQLVLIMAIFFLIVFLGLRFFVMGCELFLGLFIGSIIFGSLGYGWYRFAESCSARDSDIFGIVQGILPPGASDPPPMTCVYTKP